MVHTKLALTFVLALWCSTANQSFLRANDTSNIFRVFILAGQSNMAGHGVVDLDDPNDYNAGKGNLESVIANSKDKERFQHLKDSSGNWRVRDDVLVWNATPHGVDTGSLTVGFTNYENDDHHFGPELQIGHVLGDAFDEPVLLIKTAWGGKSLYRDFRPPGVTGDVGPKYIEMFENIADAMDDAPRMFPALNGRRAVVSGFFWQQGWNDMIDDQATAEYAQNLQQFINDVRNQLNVPNLPFVYGELGNGGQSEASAKMIAFREAQSAASSQHDRNVEYVKTARFARDAQQSPNLTHLHHWYGNAESYFLVGDALGKSMVKIIKEQDKPRVLILGDSISIGYTPHVKKMLANEAVVVRPMINEKRPENCSGTDKGLENIDRWLKMDGGKWDVIHFNWGLHDLKHVDAKTGKNSNKPEDPLQTPPDEYEKQLTQLVDKLKKTNAKLICCLTTPVPPGCKPRRSVDSPGIYNKIASKIAKQNNIQINDLYTFANDRLKEIQKPANVHFTQEGSKMLANKVVESIREALPKKD